MNKIIRYAGIGIGYGSFSFLMMLMYNPEISATRANITSTLLMSAMIGIIAILFDIESLNFLLALGIHFITTLALVIPTMMYNGWLDDISHTPEFWIIFIVIYVGVWFISCISSALKVNKINRALAKKRTNRHTNNS